MNYDTIAAMKVSELRAAVRSILGNYNYLTGQRITSREISSYPKSRLLYIICRFEAEVDAKNKYSRMREELNHRASLLAERLTKKVYRITVEEE